MRVLEAKLVHDPTRFDPIGSPVFVEHQCLSHPNNPTVPRIHHTPILTRGLPVPALGGPIRSIPGCVLSISKAEEVPL